ncbi:protein suppressor of white apricot [Daktulosphaira vitifoliae]|uniref:protein suppressor of white apricot n=1 Tax=Daktulosphaira vitifoliae TaxID=58002 RepID=UPI0021AA8DF5|nr:protein suppressor of white apricot [Daktulosphaira vitifoliae]XP_050520949.1 protein suppressor of white apricot [Daktulosphaira vitifoliae]XP_050520959.1 protein suppressor of white apricot [Daktulosphaira vitifoliae]
MSYINAYKNRSNHNGTSEDEKQTLLVFGYSCKLFKDDEKALFIDQGKHLIPWMGDDTLKIDRYDCRGALSDLKSVEALPFGQSQWEGLTPEEKKIEQLCDEERYKSLNDKSEEEQIYQEEELKRLHQALNNEEKEYGQVGYKYEDEITNSSEIKPVEDTDYETELEEAFIPPRELDIPSNMHVPPTKKLNAIIEKTALFISKHGAQMEVLLKAKQAHNPQFEFLSYDQPLYPYYQHVLAAIRSCRYNPTLVNDSTEDSLDSSNEDSYLHPSLLKSAKQHESAPFIPNILYKPSADCSYSLLVNKIKEKQSAMPVEEEISKNEDLTCSTNVIISEFDGLTKSARRRLKKKLVSQSALNASNSPESDEANIIEKPTAKEEIYKESNITNTPQPIVASGIEVPPTDLQIIIDKMASYVTKNGKQFEETARMRQDPRLKFLEPTDCFNAYYLQKLKLYATIKRLEQTAPSKSTLESKATSKLPVCFSLKKQKEAEAMEIKKSALNDSSNEMSDDDHNKDLSKRIDQNPNKTNKSLKKNPLQNSARLAEERLKDKLAMAAKEKLALLERERTKKEKEKIQAERKRKAAQFLAAMKIVPSSSKNSTSNIDEKPTLSENIPNEIEKSEVKKLVNTENGGLSNNNLISDSCSKGLDVISIGSSDEEISSSKDINGDKINKSSLQTRLQETLSREEKRKRLDNYEKEKDFYKRMKRYDEAKEKSSDCHYLSREKDRSRRHSKKTHSNRHSSSKDHKRDRSRRHSKHKHKSKKSKKKSHNRSSNSDSSDDSDYTNNSHQS